MVTIVCVIAVAVYGSGASPFEEFEDIIALCLVCLRYVVPIVQLILWFYHGRHRQNADDETNSIIFTRFGIRSTHNAGSSSRSARPDLEAGDAGAGTPTSGLAAVGDTSHRSRSKAAKATTVGVYEAAKTVDDDESEVDDEHSRLTLTGPERAAAAQLGSIAHGLNDSPANVSDSDDGSLTAGTDALDNVLRTHLRATRHHASGSMDAIDSFGLSPRSPGAGVGDGDSPQEIQSPFVVGRQMAAF